jgi:hypothetical protein
MELTNTEATKRPKAKRDHKNSKAKASQGNEGYRKARSAVRPIPKVCHELSSGWRARIGNTLEYRLKLTWCVV